MRVTASEGGPDYRVLVSTPAPERQISCKVEAAVVRRQTKRERNRCGGDQHVSRCADVVQKVGARSGKDIRTADTPLPTENLGYIKKGICGGVIRRSDCATEKVAILVGWVVDQTINAVGAAGSSEGGGKRNHQERTSRVH
jgi:hypothetical protein